ncbi:MAG: DnaA/Hda family protein [Thermoguttaceae bacterium]
MPALRSSLAGKVGQERFDLWFGAATRLDYDGATLEIGVPNRFFLEWIRSNFRQQLEGACRDVLGRCPALVFQLDVAPAKTESSSKPDAVRRIDPTAGVSPVAGVIAPISHRQADASADAAIVSHATATEKAGTDGGATLPRRRFASLETFVAGETNRLAIASAQMVIRRPGQVTPLMFHGPTSVGKTHLLEGIWTAARKSHRRLATVYLSAEQFTSQFLEALRGSGLPNFRRKYRGVGLLIVDDLQFLLGKRATQVELLHTIDGFIREGRQLVFAADRSPAELAELGPELITRLTGGLVCGIEPPDHAARLAIVGQMAQRMKLHVPADVQQLVASRLTTHSRQLSGALCRLQATSEALGQPISLSLAEEALADLVSHNGRVVRLPDIERAVCEVFGLEPTSLHSETKGKGVSHPRMLAMWLARKHTRAALSEIGHYFGRRSHSTVVSAQKRVDGWMADGRTLDLAEHRWSTDDAIRKVERRLAAG